MEHMMTIDVYMCNIALQHMVEYTFQCCELEELEVLRGGCTVCAQPSITVLKVSEVKVQQYWISVQITY